MSFDKIFDEIKSNKEDFKVFLDFMQQIISEKDMNKRIQLIKDFKNELNSLSLMLLKYQEIYRNRKKEDVGFFLAFRSYAFDEDDRYGETERVICVNNPEKTEIDGEFISFSYLTSRMKDSDHLLVVDESVRIDNLKRIFIKVFHNKELEIVNI
jgi:hypothetical protein